MTGCIIILFTVLNFYGPLPFQGQKQQIKPNPFKCSWWVCAYCGKKHEDTEASCTCRDKK